MKKKAIAGVIVTIILILLVLASIVIFWNFYNFFLKEGLSEVGTEGLFVGGKLEYYLPNEFAIIDVHRTEDSGQINGLKILFNEKGEGSYSFKTSDYPQPFEKKRYVIFKDDLIPEPEPISTWNFGKIASISLHYLFPEGKISNQLDEKEINQKRISEDFDCFYDDNDRDGYGDYQAKCEKLSEAISGKSPSSDDCRDDDSSVNPGAVETCNNKDDNCNSEIDENEGDCSGEAPYCNEGVCDDIKNYKVSLEGLGARWEDCNEHETNEEFTFSFNSEAGWPLQFYKDNVNSVTICKNGYILVEGSCSDTVNNIRTIKGIAPYYYFKSAFGWTGKTYYCIKSDYIIFKWKDKESDSFEAEVKIYKNGLIIYSYNNNNGGAVHAEVGISYGETHYNQIVNYGTDSIANDYVLEF